MMLEKEMAGHSAEVTEVVGKYGQKACDFIWENKGALAVGTTLTAFLANPEPFLNGTVKVASAASESVARPLAEGVAKGTNWTVVILVLLAFGGAVVAVKYRLFAIPKNSPPQEDGGDGQHPA